MATNQKKLNKEQLEAIQYGEGPLLIIAGAGTGKTTVITERIKWLILKKKVHPSEILALTFTDKAAQEMEERVDQALPYGYTQMWISTFHSFCDRVLRQDAIHIGLDPGFRLMTEAESILFLRKRLFELDLDYFRPLGNPTKFLEGMLQHFSRLKDEDVSVEQYLQYTKKLKVSKEEIMKTLELANAFKKYEELKAKEGVMDFSDLISNTLKLFRLRKNVLSEYQKKFQYVLVDEFQDTNFSQNELAILLAGDRKNITVVGDDDQAIYRFRGASISNIMQFKNHYKSVKTVTLAQNYRSTQEILNKAYTLIQHNNPDRLEVKAKIDKKLRSDSGVKGAPVAFLHADRVENEADLVAKKIRELTSSKQNSVYQYKDFAILVRANDHAEPFVRSLSRAGIPYQFLGPGQLFRQEEVKNLVCYLKVLYNFEDNVSLYRVLSMDVFGLAARDLAALLNFARRKNMGLFETLERVDETFLQDEVKEKVKKIVSMIKRHLGLIPKETAGQILYYFAENSGLLRRMIDYKTTKEEKTAQNMARFFDKLKTYETENADASVSAVVEWIDLSMQMGESPLAANIDWTEVNAVNILTIHSSKGLEFPVVFLVNLVEQRFPTRERAEKIPLPDQLIKELLPTGDFHLEEERRLFYVGMTRARDYLFLTAANFYGEGKRERKISPFVYETLGEDMVKKAKVKRLDKEAMGQLTLLDWGSKTEELKDSKIVPIPVEYLSYSQIDTFSICPMHYRAKYILKLPAPPSSAQSFGTSIHAALRDFYQEILQGKKTSEELLFALLEKRWINEGYMNKHHEQYYREQGKRMLSMFLKTPFDKTRKPIALELPFKFRIKNLQIGGRIDRIDSLASGHIEIIDYKTGKVNDGDNDVSNNKQLTMYALAANQVQDGLLGKKPEEISLSFYYLDKGMKVTTQRTGKQLEEAKEWLFAKAEEISKSDFLCSKSILCEKCEYKMLCG